MCVADIVIVAQARLRAKRPIALRSARYRAKYDDGRKCAKSRMKSHGAYYAARARV